jgi:hypothetical protein
MLNCPAHKGLTFSTVKGRQWTYLGRRTGASKRLSVKIHLVVPMVGDGGGSDHLGEEFLNGFGITVELNICLDRLL